MFNKLYVHCNNTDKSNVHAQQLPWPVLQTRRKPIEISQWAGQPQSTVSFGKDRQTRPISLGKLCDI